jgi:hypothetical protein
MLSTFIKPRQTCQFAEVTLTDDYYQVLRWTFSVSSLKVQSHQKQQSNKLKNDDADVS